MWRLVGRNLCFDHPSGPALIDCDIRLAPGKATALVGPSGSGKTTLLWVLAGLLRPRAGSVAIVADDAPDRAADRRPLRVGMVFQQPTLWDHLTVEEHLRLVLSARPAGRGPRRERVEQVLSRMQLQPLRKRLPGELSGGEGQRLAIARAVVGEPELLLLDEPLAHLDGQARTDLLDLLAGVLATTRAAVLLATHNAPEALRIADDVAVLLAGRIVQAGPAQQVYRRPVSLPAARALGPACELAGQARAGRLLAGDACVLAGLDASLTGPQRLILRPEDVAFEPDDAGPAELLAAAFTGAGYQLRLRAAGGAEALALSPAPLAAGTRGRLRLRPPPQPPAGP